MRVCVVAEFYPRRRDPALGIWAHRQALAARDAGADVQVLALERPVPAAGAVRDALRGRPAALVRELRGMAGQPRHDSLDGIEVEYVRFVSPPRGRSYANWHRWARRPLGRAFARLRERFPFDLVHAHYALPAGAAARPFTAERGLPLVVSLHGGDLFLPGAEQRANVADTLRAADAVLCNSRDTLRRAGEAAGSDEGMRVVHLGASAPAHPVERAREPTVATVGDLIPRKGHADVARALAELRRCGGPSVCWVVIGDGPERTRIEALARELGIQTEFTGRLAPESALERLAACHVMALPSVNEAFGVAYIEALRCGVPAIGCRGEGGPEEIAALGPGMVLVPPRDPEVLAATLGGLLSDPAALDELAARGRRTAEQHFSWERCGRETVAAYEDVLRR